MVSVILRPHQIMTGFCHVSLHQKNFSRTRALMKVPHRVSSSYIYSQMFSFVSGFQWWPSKLWKIFTVSLGFQTDTRKGSMADGDSRSDVKQRMARSDIRTALGNQMEPAFWPTRGRRSNSEHIQPPLWTNNEKSPILLPYWRSGEARKISELWLNTNVVRLTIISALPIRKK